MSEGKVAKNTAYLVAAFVGQKLLSFVYFTIVARAVGVEGSGKYVVATSFTTIFSVFVDMGLANVLVRETARLPEKAGRLLANAMTAKAILAVLSVIAVNIGAILLGYDAEVRTMIAIASAVMVLDSVHLVFYAVMRGMQNLRYEAIGVVTGQAVIIAIGLLFYKMRLPLPFLIVALLCGSVWNVVWSSYALAARMGTKISFAFDRDVLLWLRDVTLPFALAGIFSRVYSYLDSILLSKLAPDAATATGIYGVAYKLAFAFQFLPMAFAAAVYPAMSDLYVRDRAKLAALFSRSFRYLLLLALPLAFGAATLARPILLTVYGEQFVPATLPLQILMFSLVFAFLYWPAGSLLNACDRQAQNTQAMGITVVTNALLNVLLIPRFGATGAAVAALVGNATLWLLATIHAQDLVGAKVGDMARGAAQALLAAACMGLVLRLLDGSLHVAALIPIGAVVYVVTLVGVGGVTLRELRDLSDVFLRRGKKISDIMA